jgi:hypothetical protein
VDAKFGWATLLTESDHAGRTDGADPSSPPPEMKTPEGRKAIGLGDAGQVTAPRGQRKFQRRDRHPEAALAIWWRRLGVRLGDG